MPSTSADPNQVPVTGESPESRPDSGLNTASISDVAIDLFGWKKLRPGQREAIADVTVGRDTLVVMPTGGGKSAIYQIAGRLLGGLTVVISPLIALQRDQRQFLEDVPAAFQVRDLNSTLSAADRTSILDEIRAGIVDYLFLAPEQLANDEVLTAVSNAAPRLFAVDEAHCVVSWGHDFRPDYLRLGTVIDQLGRPTVLALTATAAPPVRVAITEALRLNDPAVRVAGFDRPNLHLAVRRFIAVDDKNSETVNTAVALAKPGIVYAATRRQAEHLAARLHSAGVKVAAYHAGMKAADRSRNQDDFLGGVLEVIVATTAFGMGIDKPDVRFVLHASIPESLDSYYQEIGRAGRDGQPSTAVLFYREADLGLQKYFSTTGVDVESAAVVLRRVRRARNPITPADLAAVLTLSPQRITKAIAVLEEVGAVAANADGTVRSSSEQRAGQVRAAIENIAAKRASFDASRIAMIRGYAEADQCRRMLLLSYFGEQHENHCGYCDWCDENGAKLQPVSDGLQANLFDVGQRVRHSDFGDGAVLRTENDELVVLFDESGYHTLSVPLVIDRNLLTTI